MKPKKKGARERTSGDILRLDNQLCFALYAATRALSRTYREKLSPIGLTYPQYLVLIVLWEHDELTLKEIGLQLMLDSGTLTPLVKRMEEMGLLERRRSLSDERETIVCLKAKGKRLKQRARDARKFVGCRLGMTEQEILALRADIMDLIDQLDSARDQAGRA